MVAALAQVKLPAKVRVPVMVSEFVKLERPVTALVRETENVRARAFVRETVFVMDCLWHLARPALARLLARESCGAHEVPANAMARAFVPKKACTVSAKVKVGAPGQEGAQG